MPRWSLVGPFSCIGKRGPFRRRCNRGRNPVSVPALDSCMQTSGTRVKVSSVHMLRKVLRNILSVGT